MSVKLKRGVLAALAVVAAALGAAAIATSFGSATVQSDDD
jgi:hypothetical protein